MDLEQTCQNCGGERMVECRDAFRGGTVKQICYNCYRTGGAVPSSEGLVILKFIDKFKNWRPFKIENGLQVDCDP